ncbi:hypothetical protein [Tenggerimyces flavus]|uniref:Uncharacterized protein n=1 Tax=Tenggerimyces flavus TaxID=1708749 RepID=A0ABV7Y8M9_9ACTN|nr:hypothetical protein [Tenggerimyces flavus]MBM7791002.1 hypothetical protein [Tenggerimyces flavus]
MTGRTVRMYAAHRLHVWASATDDRGFVIEGQDLGRPGMVEYEYSLRVAPADVPRVVAALGGQPGDDVLDLLEREGELLVRAGESTWLKSLGLEPEFWSRSEYED